MGSWLSRLVWIGLGSLLSAAPADVRPEVLVLYSFSQNLPAQGRISAGLGQVIAARRMDYGAFHPEYLDINPPRSPGQVAHLRDLLLEKYKGTQLGLIITVFEPARSFMEHEARDLSPGTPVLALFSNEGGLPAMPGRQVFGIPLRYDLRGTLERALALFPRTRHVVFVSGVAESNLRVEAQARRDFAPWEGRLDFDYTSGRGIDQVAAQARHLPPDTVILFSIVTADVTGRFFVPTDALRAIASEADAPIFSILSVFLGEGVVGGDMVDPETAGRLLGHAVEEMQGGRPLPAMGPSDYIRPMFDWNQLQRWHCDLARLPADAVVVNRPPTLWGLFRPYVITAEAVFAVLCGLVLALLVLNHRRARAELALARSERLMREAQDAGQVGTYEFDLATGAIRISATLAHILGVEEDRRAGFHGWLEMVEPGHRATVEAGINRAIETFEPWDQDFPIRRPDGELRWLHSRVKADRGPSGPASRLLGTLLDITDYRRLQEDLEHTQRLESLGSLASGVAHDMNNVLASIQAVAQTLLYTRGGDPELAGPLATIELASDRGRSLVQSLTNAARKGLREPRLMDLNELVREQATLLRRTLLQKVAVEEDLDPDLPCILGESSTLGSALLNLCVNAVDAMPDGGNLALRTRRGDDGGVQLQVADTGEGMSPEVARRAMEPFFTTKPFGKGTGLGLSMVFNTIKAHGGTVQIRSKAGAGTTVHIRLPAAGAMGAVPVPDAPAPRAEPLRILLVDDDPLIRDSIPAMLAQAGYRVDVAAGGAQALARIAGGLEVDLLVLDLNMPVMGGAETLANIRSLRPDLPAVLATGFLDEATAALLAAMPRTAVLAKPYSLAQFQEKTRDLAY